MASTPMIIQSPEQQHEEYGGMVAAVLLLVAVAACALGGSVGVVLGSLWAAH